MGDELAAWVLFNGPRDELHKVVLGELCKQVGEMHKVFALDRYAFSRSINMEHRVCNGAIDRLVQLGYLKWVRRSGPGEPSLCIIKRPEEQVFYKGRPVRTAFALDSGVTHSSLFTYVNRNTRDARTRGSDSKARKAHEGTLVRSGEQNALNATGQRLVRLVKSDKAFRKWYMGQYDERDPAGSFRRGVEEMDRREQAHT